MKRHVDQLHQKGASTSSAPSQVVDDYYFPGEPDTPTPQPEIEGAEVPRQDVAEHRYPQRHHHPLDRYIQKHQRGEEIW